MSRTRYALAVAMLAGFYVAAAKFGIEQPVAHGVITPVWAPTGIAIATLIVFGWRLWPGVALGAFVANATSGVSMTVAFGICVGNTLEALVAVYLLTKVGFRPLMDRVRDVISFAGLAAITSTAVSATVGVTSLMLAGIVSPEVFLEEWWLWWFGDLIGAILVAPAIMVTISHVRARRRLDRPFESIGLFLAVAATSVIVFLGGNWQYPYLVFPLLVWSALRIRQVGATVAVLFVGAIATWGTVHGSVPLGGVTPTQNLQILQGLIAVVALAIFLIAATIAEKDEAEKDARTTFEHLQEAQRLAHVGSWEWDVANGKIAWSDELFRIYGYEPQSFELDFEKAMERVVDEDRVRIEANLRAGFDSGTDQQLPEVQYDVVHEDRTVRTLRGWGYIWFKDGDPDRMVGTVQDVTEIVRVEAALEEAYARAQDAAERLRELDATKNTFISAAAHDLRGPLATIAGFAHVLEDRHDDLPDDKAREMLSRISTNADRMNRMLNNLLDLDRLQRGDVHASMTEVDLNDVALRVVHALDLDREIDVAPMHVMATVDEFLIERVIENLVLNACRHTPPGTSVRIRIAATSEGVEIVVEDSGPGVPDELKSSVFEAFKRADEHGPGTGLGLFLVARFAELHRGRVWLEDRPGGGAVFRVTIPHPPPLGVRAP